ncbi:MULTISPECIES: YbaB/EbfC family nucleoid-associated protein [Clostridium]|uniref:Nucleoid-associated protein JK634_18170 n=1 Tax=Clostridium paridis TaxID=2803863 RepID=A0A937FKL6_9CLOT|nr:MULTISPECIES: YbaB/EbfC family nucleoid-associated protein [Clostridium]MBL4933711.1 YbaB/EbfC family nucleoid-associated protein [Clostridium paridis]MDD7796126.1 YbaB/EbfC family nucleoid-associated protein [Clostridium sp. 'White wine YQ']
MAKGGFPGGGLGNMNNLMKQAQKLQQQMEEMQKELEVAEFEATVGGGAVLVKVNGKKEVTHIEIKPEVVDPDDVEMLQDLVLSAVNQAMKKADEETSSKMGKLTGGMNMPGLF